MEHSRIKVYVTGPLKGVNKFAAKKHREDLTLTCRRIIVGGHNPICPVLMCEGWDKDPRLPGDPIWWVTNIYKSFMQECKVFCLVRPPAAVNIEHINYEKSIWRDIGDGRFITSDIILEHLLQLDANELFKA